MSRTFTRQNTYKDMEIKMQEGEQADVRILDAIEENIDTAMRDGAGQMVVYDVILPRQYATQDNSNSIFSSLQADTCDCSSIVSTLSVQTINELDKLRECAAVCTLFADSPWRCPAPPRPV